VLLFQERFIPIDERCFFFRNGSSRSMNGASFSGTVHPAARSLGRAPASELGAAASYVEHARS
jgi:hypothetical protein